MRTSRSKLTAGAIVAGLAVVLRSSSLEKGPRGAPSTQTWYSLGGWGAGTCSMRTASSTLRATESL